MPSKTIIPVLFKVLVDNEPCQGGSGAYPPKGKWTKKVKPTCCESGWHLTSDPLGWWKRKAELWLAEGRGPLSGDGSEKAAFESVRLVEQVTRKWRYLPMFPRVRAFLAATARSIDQAADIGWADLAGANLAGAYLVRAYLVGANLADANLVRAYLVGADLAGANLAGANLVGANLAGANLMRAYLVGANLAGANLVGAYRPDHVPQGWAVGIDGCLEIDGYLERENDHAE